MKRRYYGLLIIFLFFLSLASCGTRNQPGSPGSDGDTGVIMSNTIIPLYNGVNTNDIDAVQDLCPDGKAEPFFRHQATFTISVLLERPDLNILPANVYIDEYTIDYVRSSDSAGAPPIEQYREFVTITPLMPAVGATSASITPAFTGMLMDIPRKLKYASDMTSGQFTSEMGSVAILNNYTAVYTFYGKNDFGQSFKIVVSVPFVIGDFDNCGA